jgi:NAD(P)-dependent dehydrogenase (short-subunit alcohol dehydrogenase family)
MDLSLDGKVALVTGGASGLGRMIAEGLLSSGAKIIITSRKDAVEAAAQMTPLGHCRGINVVLDGPEGFDDLKRQLESVTDRLHVIINNAGRTWGAPLEQFPDKAWTSVMTTNVHAPFAVVQRLLPLLLTATSQDDPARVINIGSVAGIAVQRLNAYSYAASKAALHQLSRDLAAELGPLGITVNTVVPGYFPTRMTAHIRGNEDEMKHLEARIPMGRLGQPRDIAALCVFLAASQSGYITGAEICVDGGISGCR